MNVLTVAVVQVAAAVAFVSGVRSLAVPHNGRQSRCPPGLWIGLTLWVAGSLLATPAADWLLTRVWAAPTALWVGLSAVLVSFVTVFTWIVRRFGGRRPRSGSCRMQVERRAGVVLESTSDGRRRLPRNPDEAAASTRPARNLTRDTSEGRVPSVSPHRSPAGTS